MEGISNRKINLAGTARGMWKPGPPAAVETGCSRKIVSTALVSAIILAALLFPDLPVYLGINNSNAFGTVIVAAIIVVVTGIVWLIQPKMPGWRWHSAGAAGILAVIAAGTVVTIHGCISNLIVPLDLRRFLASLAPLAFLLVAALAISYLIRLATRRQMIAVSWISFSVCCLFLAERLLKLEPLASRFNAATFPFTERSTFALAFGPLLVYTSAVIRSSRRTIWVLVWLAIAVAFRNATMVVFVLLSAAVCRRILLVTVLALVVLVSGFTQNFKYYTSRADLSSRSRNISALVYLQGWELLGDSMRISDAWGLGFQQMGQQKLNLPISEAIVALDGGAGYLNLQDGSFLLSKLASEFGVLGLALVAGYSVLAVRCFKYLRAGSAQMHDGFAHAIILGFVVDIFVRGVGYFSGDSLLFLGALFSLIFFRKEDRAPRADSRSFSNVRVS